MARQSTLREQLEDSVFRKWMTKVPAIDTMVKKPWWIYVQRKKKGPWQRVAVSTYEKAYAYVLEHLDEYYDMAISHKLHRTKPPVVFDKTLGRKQVHLPPSKPLDLWCSFCRRMTKFTYFSRHHAMPPYLDPTVRRCTICGARINTATRW